MTEYDFHLTEEDKKETSKLMKEVIKELKKEWLIKNDNDYETEKGDILFFIHLKKNKIVEPWKYRDKDKNLIEILKWQSFWISLKSDINKNGVGDWKEPEIARTYSINLWLMTNRKDYRRQTWYNKELGFYMYDRSLENLIKRFNDRIKTLDFITKLELKKEG